MVMWYSQPYKDALDLQRLISKTAPESTPKDLAALGRSFVALEMLKLRLRMKPAPKPIDVSIRQGRRRARNVVAFTEVEEARPSIHRQST